jgi:hypothetical protein
MSIVSFDRDSVVDYIPEYGGNRESADPCVVSLKFVPYSRVQEYSRLLAARTRGVADPVKVAELTQHVQKKQFVENVESVSGYFVGSTKVTSAGEFFDTADTDLVLEVIGAMESASRLTEGQRKN